jgi:heterotetrameric sarcosine oxidase gamma subunit
VARLIATGAFDGLPLPLSIGTARLSALDPGPAWSIAPFRGHEAAVSRALGGAALPHPGQAERWGEGRLLWIGPGRFLLSGRPPPDGLAAHAAVAEQGDGLAVALLEGPSARDILARLVPLDLGDAAFPEGATARTLLQHMAVTLTRSGPYAWEIMAMRSMAGTLVDEVGHAMRHVAARASA